MAKLFILVTFYSTTCRVLQSQFVCIAVISTLVGNLSSSNVLDHENALEHVIHSQTIYQICFEVNRRLGIRLCPDVPYIQSSAILVITLSFVNNFA